MKKIILTLSATVCLLQSEAKVWRVNNTSGISADFTSLSTAISTAAAGDTLLIEGSVTDYSSVTINKKLHIIGSGYFLNDATPNPNLQFNKSGTTIGTITYSPGSKGSVIQGCSVAGFILDDSLITIQRNRITGSIGLAYNNNISGDTIRNNYMTSYFTNYNNGKKISDLFVYNNIFTYHYAISLNSSNMNTANGYFVNNSFINNSCKFECVSFVFQNNIIGNADFSPYGSSNTYFNNIAQNSGIPSGNGNLLNVSSNSIYNGWSSGTGYSSDARYQLKAGAPAIGAGILNGVTVDCGAFGGPAPYILSGMPSVPSIYDFSAPSQVTFGTGSINVNISAAVH